MSTEMHQWKNVENLWSVFATTNLFITWKKKEKRKLFNEIVSFTK